MYLIFSARFRYCVISQQTWKYPQRNAHRRKCQHRKLQCVVTLVILIRGNRIADDLNKMEMEMDGLCKRHISIYYTIHNTHTYIHVYGVLLCVRCASVWQMKFDHFVVYLCTCSWGGWGRRQCKQCPMEWGKSWMTSGVFCQDVEKTTAEHNPNNHLESKRTNERTKE